jgi:hypothetical protein
VGIIFCLSQLVYTRWVTDAYIHTAVRSPTCVSVTGLVKHKALRRPSAHCELSFPHLALDDEDETAKPRLAESLPYRTWMVLRKSFFSDCDTSLVEGGMSHGQSSGRRSSFLFHIDACWTETLQRSHSLETQACSLLLNVFLSPPPHPLFFINTCTQLYPILPLFLLASDLVGPALRKSNLCQLLLRPF